MKKTEYEFIGVSTLAERLGISKQAVYCRIRKGYYDVQKYNRGSMNGWLIKVEKDNACG